MGKRTGQPRGRPRGSKSKTTIARKARIAEAADAIEALLPKAFKGDSHALLMAIYKDEAQPLPLRLDAAKAAIGYEIPKLAAVEHSGNQDKPIHNRTVVEHRVIDVADNRTDHQDERPEEARTAH